MWDSLHFGKDYIIPKTLWIPSLLLKRVAKSGYAFGQSIEIWGCYYHDLLTTGLTHCTEA